MTETPDRPEVTIAGKSYRLKFAANRFAYRCSSIGWRPDFSDGDATLATVANFLWALLEGRPPWKHPEDMVAELDFGAMESYGDAIRQAIEEGVDEPKNAGGSQGGHTTDSGSG